MQVIFRALQDHCTSDVSGLNKEAKQGICLRLSDTLIPRVCHS